MFKNKRGIVMWGAVPAYMVWAFGAQIVATVLLTPSFRVNKAVEKCVSISGDTEDACKGRISQMSSENVLAFIKDDATTGNGGNFRGGNSNP